MRSSAQRNDIVGTGDTKVAADGTLSRYTITTATSLAVCLSRAGHVYTTTTRLIRTQKPVRNHPALLYTAETMVEVKKYQLPPTDLIPNSPHPLLHYPGLLDHLQIAPDRPEEIHDRFHANGWQTQWIYRYGPTQPSHYHSHAHEVMAVLSGTATIRFGVADVSADLDTNAHEAGGVEVLAKAGDVFVLPAGTAHKTFDTTPGDFALLTPGDGHRVEAGDVRGALAAVRVRDGFVMMGAYPVDGGEWDFAVGGDRGRQEYDGVWAVPTPGRDPVLGMAEEGIRGQWKQGPVLRGAMDHG